MGRGRERREEGITDKLLGFIGKLAGALVKISRMALGALGRIISWIGGLILLFGAYSALGGEGFELAWLGIAVICIGEAMVFLKGLSDRERLLLEENILGTLLKNMAFPLLWLVAYYFLGMDFLLAFAVSSGIRALIENARITASFYILL
jgi:hypothetical protein